MLIDSVCGVLSYVCVCTCICLCIFFKLCVQVIALKERADQLCMEVINAVAECRAMSKFHTSIFQRQWSCNANLTSAVIGGYLDHLN